MAKTWIVVADNSRARVCEVADRNQTLIELEDLVNPAGRLHDSELRTDNAGRYFGKGERMQGHAARPRTEPGEHETELFAKRVADYIERARLDHRFERLCLIAAPKFLGVLRQHLSKSSRDLVFEELDKDVSWLEGAQLQDYVREKLAAAGD
ncbi:MAG TPA: host attachment protein [Burkholderiales bacterium]|nr:host attachment protein [Burkholderiales bacterium]